MNVRRNGGRSAVSRRGERPGRSKETPGAREMMHDFVSLVGDGDAGFADTQLGGELYPEVNVRSTHWIDEAALERLDHDNESEEIVRSYGGGD